MKNARLTMMAAVVTASMLVFAACGSDQSSSAADAKDQTVSAAEEAVEEAAEETASAVEEAASSVEAAAEEKLVGGDNSRGAGAVGDREKAESLINSDLSRDELEAAIGTCGDFEMSSKGCERGVYAGLFYYDNFILHSRTYDMGKTFHITAVNVY